MSGVYGELPFKHIDANFETRLYSTEGAVAPKPEPFPCIPYTTDGVKHLDYLHRLNDGKIQVRSFIPGGEVSVPLPTGHDIPIRIDVNTAYQSSSNISLIWVRKQKIEELREKAYALCLAIEKLPASTEQTELSLAASNINQKLQELLQ